MDLVQPDIELGDSMIERIRTSQLDPLAEAVARRMLNQARDLLDNEVAPHVTPDTPAGRRLTEQRDKLTEQLGQLDYPASVVQVDPSGAHAQDQRPVVESPTPGHGHAAGKLVDSSLPGTSATDLETNPPPVREADLPSSALHRMTLIERLVDTLGLDPRIVAVATTAGGMAAIAESLPALALRFGLKVCVVCGLMQNNLPTDRPGAIPRSTPG